MILLPNELFYSLYHSIMRNRAAYLIHRTGGSGNGLLKCIVGRMQGSYLEHWTKLHVWGIEQTIIYYNLCGRTVGMLGCQAEVPGPIPGPGEMIVWSTFSSLVSLSVIFGCLCVCPWHPRYSVSVVRGSECVRHL